MDQSEIHHLLERYSTGNASEEEIAFLESWYLEHAAKPTQLTQDDVVTAETLMAANLQKHINIGKKIKLWPLLGAAAAVAAFVVLGVYLFNSPHQPEVYSGSQTAKIVPGKNTATLIVNNLGRTITLSDAKTGIKINNNQLSYNDGTAAPFLAEVLSNEGSESLTLLTPRGGMYQMMLSDGTKVWLNADSRLEFPAKFGKNKDRIVKITGEGYFEVAKDKLNPFIVESDGQRITVLGTHFNVSAYKGEYIKTTLLEGSVKVNDVRLRPNQQSTVTGSSGIDIKQVDAEDEIAWKDGKFVFNREDIKTIMKKVGRWYDVEIEYKDNVGDLPFSGTISRREDVTKLLNVLQKTGMLNYKIEGRKIILSK